jgi:hypothetical protein
LAALGARKRIFGVNRLPLPERDPELEYDCPGLASAGYAIKSAADPWYNCVAFAVGDLENFWYDAKVNGYYWPPGCASADTIEGWVEVFLRHGYTDALLDGSFQSEFEKVAIYGSANHPEHVARQTSSGTWVSKMGRGHDIEHYTLTAVESEIMGSVMKIMKRTCRDGRRVLE